VLSGPWYLDQRSPGTCGEEWGVGHPEFDYSLDAIYKCLYDVEPLEGLTSEQATHILGGEAAQWSLGAAAFDGRVWTNAAAVAERLWSPRGMNSSLDTQGLSGRLADHVCRMNGRGIGANSFTPGYCWATKE
jgi:N-acetyl-beta-hexosaminidase